MKSTEIYNICKDYKNVLCLNFNAKETYIKNSPPTQDCILATNESKNRNILSTLRRLQIVPYLTSKTALNIDSQNALGETLRS